MTRMHVVDLTCLLFQTCVRKIEKKKKHNWDILSIFFLLHCCRYLAQHNKYIRIFSEVKRNKLGHHDSLMIFISTDYIISFSIYTYLSSKIFSFLYDLMSFVKHIHSSLLFVWIKRSVVTLLRSLTQYNWNVFCSNCIFLLFFSGLRI